MARILMVGAPCRALDLARELRADGHAVRATTRTEAGRQRIEAVGAECFIADPDVVGTLRYALENVTVLMWLFGHIDTPELHGPRWEMMLWRTIDTTVRGIVYEAGPPGGVALTETMATHNGIPFAVLRASSGSWPADARQALALTLKPTEIQGSS